MSEADLIRFALKDSIGKLRTFYEDKTGCVLSWEVLCNNSEHIMRTIGYSGDIPELMTYLQRCQIEKDVEQRIKEMETLDLVFPKHKRTYRVSLKEINRRSYEDVVADLQDFIACEVIINKEVFCAYILEMEEGEDYMSVLTIDNILKFLPIDKVRLHTTAFAALRVHKDSVVAI